MRTPERKVAESREVGVTSQSEVAAYVAALSADLSLLSRRNGLSTLAYLLDMAKLEAENVARAGRGEAAASS